MIELLITCALILTVAALAVPNLLSALNAAKIARAVADVHAIGTDVMGYDATEISSLTLWTMSATEPIGILGEIPTSI